MAVPLGDLRRAYQKIDEEPTVQSLDILKKQVSHLKLNHLIAKTYKRSDLGVKLKEFLKDRADQRQIDKDVQRYLSHFGVDEVLHLTNTEIKNTLIKIVRQFMTRIHVLQELLALKAAKTVIEVTYVLAVLRQLRGSLDEFLTWVKFSFLSQNTQLNDSFVIV